MGLFKTIKRKLIHKMHTNPVVSTLTKEEYEAYKDELETTCSTSLLLSRECPCLYFDDERRQIVLLSFNGLVEEDNCIIIPYGVTTIYVTDHPINAMGNEVPLGLNSDQDSEFTIKLAETVEYIDYLPAVSIKELDTSKVRALRLLNNNNRGNNQIIDTLIINENLYLSACSGLLKVKKLQVYKESKYTLREALRFMDKCYLKNITVDSKCMSTKCSKLDGVKISVLS